MNEEPSPEEPQLHPLAFGTGCGLILLVVIVWGATLTMGAYLLFRWIRPLLE